MIGVGAQPPPYAPAVYEAPKKGGRGYRVDSVLEELVSRSFSCFLLMSFAVTHLTALHLDLRNGSMFLSHIYVPPFC